MPGLLPRTQEQMGKETPRPDIQEEQEDKKRKWATLRRYLHGQPEDQQKGPLTFLERKCRMRGRRAMRRVSGGSWSGRWLEWRPWTQRSSYLSELFLGRGGPVGGADGGGRGEVPLAGCGEAHGVDAEHHCFARIPESCLCRGKGCMQSAGGSSEWGRRLRCG